MKKTNFSDEDFQISKLPSTRKSQFKDICLHSYRLLFGFGLVMLLFFIPYIAAYIFRIISNVGISSLLIDKGIKDKDLAMSLTYLTLLFDLINIPCYIIISIGLAGYSIVFRNLIYGEGVLFKYDFKKGIKTNSKYYVLASSIYGCIKLIVNFLCNYSTLLNSVGFNILTGILLVLFFLLIVPTLFYFTVNHTLYNMKISSGFSNAFRITLSTFFVSILLGLIIYFVKYINLLPFPLVKILIIMFLLVLIFPFFYLVFLLFSVATYDKLLNEKYHKSIYHKGLSTYQESNFDEE